jgi:hypothetical protein
MTVLSTNYSTLEEVWGESFSSTQKGKKDKKKDKKAVDPICQLYEMGNNSGYTENDIVSYANTYFDKYDKTKHQRTMNDDEGVLPRERPTRHVVINENKNAYDTSDDLDEPLHEIQETRRELPRRELPRGHKKESSSNYYDEDLEESKPSFAFIDLLLYIVSGIILIFVMEQFVKIGLLLQ